MGLINLIIDQILYLWKNSRNSDWNEFYELCRDVIGKPGSKIVCIPSELILL